MSKDNRLHTGKEFDSMHGLNLYDNQARLYDPVYGNFTGLDPLADHPKQIAWSPYAHCANNPLNVIDTDGREIIVLRNSSGAHRTGHAAIMVGSNKGGWTYISKDGYTGSPMGSTPKYVVEQFNTLSEFSNSPHNFVLETGTHSTTEGKSATSFDFKIDKDGNKEQRYDKALLIETKQKDGTSTDSKAIQAATESAKSDYKLTQSDCSDVVTNALNISKNSSGQQIKNGENNFLLGGLRSEMPNQKFNMIENRNKDSERYDNLIIPN